MQIGFPKDQSKLKQATISYQVGCSVNRERNSIQITRALGAAKARCMVRLSSEQARSACSQRFRALKAQIVNHFNL
jgi:hypothetical protein